MSPNLGYGPALALILLATSPSCATSWAISELTTDSPPLEENVRSARVPVPDVVETLTLRVHIAGRPPAPTPSDQPAPPTPPPRLAVECAVTQTGTELEYRAATRYGSRWKVASGIAFLAEGLVAGTLYATQPHGTGLPYALVFGTDALATGVLFFMPTYDAYEHRPVKETIDIRKDCPDGLAFEIDGRSVPVDGRGEVDDAGEAVFEAHMARPAEPWNIQATIGAARVNVPIDHDRRFGWARRLGKETNSYADPAPLYVILNVPLGTASGPSSALP